MRPRADAQAQGEEGREPGSPTHSTDTDCVPSVCMVWLGPWGFTDQTAMVPVLMELTV